MAKKGLTPKMFKGMSKKRIAQTNNPNAGKRLQIKKGETATCQFLEKPDEFLEFEVHVFKEDGRWNFVPCLGDDCPLCADDDEQRRRTSYRFAGNVYDFGSKQVKVCEGGKDLAQRVYYRYERKPSTFTKKAVEITCFPTSPVSYQVELSEERALKAEKAESLTLLDLEEYVSQEAARYYGDGGVPSKSALDDDDDDLDEDDFDEDDDEDVEEYSKEDLLDMSKSELKAAAAEVGVKVKAITKDNRSKVIKAILKRQ